MKKTRLPMLFLIFVMVMSFSYPAFSMTTVEKEENYNAAVKQLESYLESSGNSSAELVGIVSAFSELGGYPQSRSFGYYVSALKKIADEEYDYELYMFLDMLERNESFNGYLKDVLKDSSIGSVEELKAYAHGRECEHEGRISEAIDCYRECMDFFDASVRYYALQQGADQAIYEEACDMVKQGDLAGAYFKLSDIIRFKDSKDRIDSIVSLLGYTPSSPDDNPQAAASNAQYLTYEILSDGTLEITGISGDYPQDFKIPQEIDGRIVTAIGFEAFSDCGSLTSVTIPNSVTSIGNQAFLRCYSLTSVTIPDSVTNIGSFAFYCCSSLTSVTIPVSVTSIGDHPFIYCTQLTKINVASGNSNFCSVNGALMDKAKTKLIQFPAGLTGTFAIPSGVTSIEESAFEECIKLTSVTIPSSVTSIGICAFSYCSSLTSVTIPNSVTCIGDSAFAGCSSLMNVIVDRGSYAENYCKDNGLKYTYAR